MKPRNFPHTSSTTSTTQKTSLGLSAAEQTFANLENLDAEVLTQLFETSDRITNEGDREHFEQGVTSNYLEAIESVEGPNVPTLDVKLQTLRKSIGVKVNALYQRMPHFQKQHFDESVLLSKGIRKMIAPVFFDRKGYTTACQAARKFGMEAECNEHTAEYMERTASIIVAYGGVIFDTAGDGIFAIFPTPESALAACIEIQRIEHESPLIFKINDELQFPAHSKIGMDYGECSFYSLQTSEGIQYRWQGSPINQASRLEQFSVEKGGCIATGALIEGVKNNNVYQDFAAQTWYSDNMKFGGFTAEDDHPCRIYRIFRDKISSVAGFSHAKRMLNLGTELYVKDQWMPHEDKKSGVGALAYFKEVYSKFKEPAIRDLIFFMLRPKMVCQYSLNVLVRNNIIDTLQDGDELLKTYIERLETTVGNRSNLWKTHYTPAGSSIRYRESPKGENIGFVTGTLKSKHPLNTLGFRLPA